MNAAEISFRFVVSRKLNKGKGLLYKVIDLLYYQENNC